MTNLTLTLPDDLAAELREAGLLSPQKLEGFLRNALHQVQDRAWWSRHFDRLEQDDEAAMSLEEIQAEVDAVRRERRRAAGR